MKTQAKGSGGLKARRGLEVALHPNIGEFWERYTIPEILGYELNFLAFIAAAKANA